MKKTTLLAVAALAIGAFAPDALADGRKPGSLLVYPVHRSGSAFLGANFTILTVVNTNPNPTTLFGFGGATNVHFEYFNLTPNGGNPFLPLGCTIFDRIEYLTPNDIFAVLTSCHNATNPLGQSGYVVVSAEDPAAAPGTSWDHDYLIGSELILGLSGLAYMVNAIPLEAINPDDPGTRIFGRGAKYEPVPDQLMTDFIAAANSNLALINLTGGPLVENAVYFSVYNDNERPLSATLRFRCWFDQPLSSVNPLFAESFLLGLPNDPNELAVTCGANPQTLETGWMTIDSQGVFFSTGQNAGSSDGAMLGSICASPLSIKGAHLLWESTDTQDNAVIGQP